MTTRKFVFIFSSSKDLFYITETEEGNKVIEESQDMEELEEEDIEVWNDARSGKGYVRGKRI